MTPHSNFEYRMQKRMFNLLVVQSSPEWSSYIQEYDLRLSDELKPPDPYDMTISVRQWKWRMRQYVQALKAHVENDGMC